MRYLQVTGIDGADLQLVDDDGQQFVLTVTDQVRSSVNSPHDEADVSVRPSLRTVDTESAAADSDGGMSAPAIADIPALPPGELVTPRTVQELLRAGHSAPQVAAAADWELAKVERYAAPIEAERSYIAGLVQDLPVGPTSGEAARTVGDRIGARLQDRGVSSTSVEWDAYRRAGHGWVVVCRFSAGGRSREASWDFRAATRSLTAIDDEARWLGEDERGGTAGPIPTPVRPVKVFDVEAEGGVTETAEPADLVSALQARSRDRRARSKRASAARHHDGLVTDAPDDRIGDDQTPADAPDTQAAAKPTVDELGHDPITGTVDLFRAVPVAAEPVEHTDDDTDGHPAEAAKALSLPTNESDPQQSSDDRGAVLGSAGESPAADLPPDVQSDPDSDLDLDLDHDPDPDSARDQRPREDPALDEPGIAAEPEEPADPGADTDMDTDAEEDAGAAAVAGVQAVRDSPADADERPTPPTRPGGSRSGRPSVPSWDDIMFGGRRGRD